MDEEAGRLYAIGAGRDQTARKSEGRSCKVLRQFRTGPRLCAIRRPRVLRRARPGIGQFRSDRRRWCGYAKTRRRCRPSRSEEHTSELQSLAYLVCRLLLEKKKKKKKRKKPEKKTENHQNS